MKEIIYTLEFDDDAANSKANAFLEKGWTLLHVGTKLIDVYKEQAHYNTVYVVGANQQQYDEYKQHFSQDEALEMIIRKMESGL